MNKLAIPKIFLLTMLAAMACSKRSSPEREWEISQQAVAFRLNRVTPSAGKLYIGKERTEFSSKKIPGNQFRVSHQLEKYDRVFDSLPDGSAFSYGFKTDTSQTIAIRRGNEWVLLNWKAFTIGIPANMKLSWVDVDGKGSKELMILLDYIIPDIYDDEMLVHPLWTDTWTGAEYSSQSFWTKARGVCILDIDSMRFVLDNAYTGFRWSYEFRQYVSGPVFKGKYMDEYPDEYHKNRRRKDFELWYDVNVIPGQNTIEVKKTSSSVTTTVDKSIRYRQKKEMSEPFAPRVISSSNDCPPMYAEGKYILRDGKFVKE